MCEVFMESRQHHFTVWCFNIYNFFRLGNEAFAMKKYDEAIAHYNEAIQLDPDNAVFYSNRRWCIPTADVVSLKYIL